MIQVIDPIEHINIHSYESMCDTVWNGESEPPSGIVYCPTEFIKKFFEKCRQHKYVLVSGCCDYGVVYQQDNHPNADLLKWAQAVNWPEILQSRGRYGAFTLGPACNPDKCLPDDYYSVKIYAQTLATFNEIPDNIIAWYCTNLAINHHRSHWLPFGINEEGNNTSAVISEYIGKPKRKLLYLNFQNHTSERVQLKQHYAAFAGEGWVTLEQKANVPYREFLNEMAQHEFVLCPSGNGLDCYRTYEALYLGCIPVMAKSEFAFKFQRLPVLLVPSLFEVTPAVLKQAWHEMYERRESFNYELLKVSHWENEINGWRKRLLEV